MRNIDFYKKGIRALAVLAGLCLMYIVTYRYMVAVRDAEAAQTMQEPEQVQESSLEEVHVQVPGLEQEYRFAFLADMHIVVENEQVAEENIETVQARRTTFVTGRGTPAADYWSDLAGRMQDYDVDGVLLGGDMIDYASDTNVAAMKAGTDQLTVPYMYLRADHDYASWYNDLDKKYIRELHGTIDDNPEVYVWEYDEFCVVGVDNTTAQISDTALEELREVFGKGKPIILVMHVPVNSLVDTSLDEQSKAAWQDRNLSWGENCYYEPDENTSEFLSWIYAKDSPVVEILAGHMHFTWDGDVTDSVHEHVFYPAYTGNIGMVIVSGENTEEN